jgi:ABC-2 type transport system ATP-binding protein
MSEPAAIEAQGLRKRFGQVVALDGVDVEVAPGQVFGLLGPNGAGKTTTVRTLITLLRPDQGSARVLGHDVVRDAAWVRARIGYVPQELSADRWLTAREHLDYFSDLYHLPAADRRRRVGELLALFGLEAVADRRLATFSGGMKKKLDVACGLVHRPPLLFLDEPSLGLDVPVRRALWRHVLDLKRGGTTVLLCSNYMDEVDALCDRIAIVDRGRVVAVGAPDELRLGLGGDVVSVELTDPAGLERAEATLGALHFARGVLREDRRLHVTVTANETALPPLIDALHRAGLGVAAVSYHRPDLEAVFLHHTGHRFATGAAAPAAAATGTEA